MRRVAAALLGIGLAGSVARGAGAQSASEIAAAKQWFAEGLALEEKAEFAKALPLFRRAAAVKKTPQILFHVGLCESRTGALVEAIVSLERAVEAARAEGNAQVEAAAQTELGALRPRVPTLEIALKGDTRPRRVTLDGNALSAAALEAALPVNPGQHELVAEFESGSVTRSFTAAEGGRSRVELEAPRPGAPPPPPAPAPAPAPGARPGRAPAGPAGAEPSSGPGVVPWLLMGGGLVATVGGFYLWKLRGDRIDELDAICPARDQCPADRASDVDELEREGKRYTTLGVALWGVGAAAIATGAYLFVSGSSAERPAGARLAPALGPGVAGAVVRGRF